MFVLIALNRVLCFHGAPLLLKIIVVQYSQCDLTELIAIDALFPGYRIFEEEGR